MHNLAVIPHIRRVRRGNRRGGASAARLAPEHSAASLFEALETSGIPAVLVDTRGVVRQITTAARGLHAAGELRWLHSTPDGEKVRASWDPSAVALIDARPGQIALALTRAQLRVTQRLVVGATVEEAARDLGVSRETVRTHVKAIYEKLGIASRGELVRVWHESG